VNQSDGIRSDGGGSEKSRTIGVHVKANMNYVINKVISDSASHLIIS